jgi:hypothetical protein
VSRSANSPASLPVPLVLLIGREREVTTVRDLLHLDDMPLLPVTSPGGVNKTRLTLQIAADLQYEFAGGVHSSGLPPTGTLTSSWQRLLASSD